MEQIKFGRDGLIPTVVQDEKDGQVLMLAYMNAESLALTLKTGYTHFFSRSRNELWKKGETSGNVQRVKGILVDCDNDTLLVFVIQKNNVACHTGERSCFFRVIEKEFTISEKEDPAEDSSSSVGIKKHWTAARCFESLFSLINDRKTNMPENSYVSYLFDKGQDKILKKIGEEATEVVIGSKNHKKSEIVSEMADLWFHSLVLLGFHDISPIEVFEELVARHQGRS